MSCFICVEQSEIAVIETFGKFNEVAAPGCHCLVPCRDTIAGTVSLRLEEMHSIIESKSKDNVFLNVHVSVQYQVARNAVEKAFYTLEQAERQIEAYVQNSVRGQIPTHNLDEIYGMRAQISDQCKRDLAGACEDYGYDIISVLLTDIEPAASVTNAMNQIQTYSRLMAATVDKAEAHKIQIVKAAEADAEAKRLSGVGLAEQRRAIVAGIQNSVENFHEGVKDLSNDEVLDMLIMNQFFDTLRDVSRNSASTTLFLSHTGGLKDIADTMNDGVISKKRV